VATTGYFVPAADLLPYWPHDLLAPSDVPGLGPIARRIGVSDFDTVEYDGYLVAFGTLAISGEIEFGIPALKALSLVLGQTGGGVTRVPFEIRLGRSISAGEAEDTLEAALALFLQGYLPPYELVLPELDVRLRVARSVLKPMVPIDAANPEHGFADGPVDAHCEFVVRGGIRVSTEAGVRVDGFDRVDLDYAQIGSTGVVIRAEDVLLRLSEDSLLPDPATFDLPADWRGVFFRELSVYNLKAAWEYLPASLELQDWYIGGDGVTGRATAIFDPNPDMSEQSFALRALDLSIEQNTLTRLLAQVAVKLDFWDDRVLWLDVAISNDPDLDFPESLGIAGAVSLEQPPLQPGAPPPLPGELVTLGLKSGDTELVRLGVTKLGLRSSPDAKRASDKGLPAATRFFDILLDGHVLIAPGVGISGAGGAHVRELGLQLAPSFSWILPAGLWIDLSEEVRGALASLPVGVRRIGFGSEGDERWIGLDASLALASDAIGASVKGMRVYFGGPGGKRVTFEGIEVRVDRAPAFTFHGNLAMTSAPDPTGLSDGDTTFTGGAKLAIGGLGLSVDGQTLFGRKAGQRFWYVALDAGLDPGVPLFAGVSLYGLALLGGNHVAPNRALSGNQGDSFNWYRHWYRPAPAPFSVASGVKWIPAPDRWAIGAGASMGSADGTAWSLKALVVVAFPGPLVIIEGRLKLLSARDGHKGPPTSDLIRGLLVADFDQGEFLLALEVNHRVPASGLLYDLHAEGEIFAAKGRPGDWHLAVGWYEPISRRVRASALKLFNWDFYLIVTGRDLDIAGRTFPGIATAVGYRSGFDKRWKFGPVRVVAAAWFSTDVALSFRPTYFLGQMALHGELALKAYGFGFELGLDARLALEAPVGNNDLTLAGEVAVRIGLPWPVPDIKLDIPISFGDASALPPPVDPLVDAASVTPGHSSQTAALFRRGTSVPAPALLPLDGRLVVDFARPMRSTWSGAPTPVDVARPDRVGDGYYRYTVTAVRVRVVPAGGGPAHPPVERVFGQWSLAAGDDGPQASSLLLWSLTPYPYAGSLTWPGRTVRRSWEDLLFEVHSTFPCGADSEPMRCLTFDDDEIGVYDPELRHHPDPLLPAVVLTGWPAGEALDAMTASYGQVVQTPLEVVDGDGKDGKAGAGRRLRLARTAALGWRDEPEGGAAATLSALQWGVAADLPPCVEVTGVLSYPREQYRVRVRARRAGALVADLAVPGTEFRGVVDAAEAFDRLEISVEAISERPQPASDDEACLQRLCWTSLGMREREDEIDILRGHWRHVFDPVVGEDPAGGPRFGAHLLHEPSATYHVDIDVRTERATTVDGPWQPVNTRTETVTTRVAGAPDDLAPYIATVVPGDGQRPVYADYDLRVTYNRQYVEAMYDVAGDPLRVEVVDGLGALVEPVADRDRTEEPGLPPDAERFLERIVDTACVTVDLGRVPGFDETTYRTRLATTTPYEVRLRGGGHPGPLHRWTFTTSRYRTFAEHVEDRRPQPWNVDLPAEADWDAVAALVAGPFVDRDAEDDAFRAALAALRVGLHTLPERPEANLLRSGDQAVRGVLLASPEPLLGDRVTVRLLDAEAADLPVAVLRSADGTRGLLVVIGQSPPPLPLDLPAGGVTIQLRYRLAPPGLPRLTRGGARSDEVVAWPVAVPPPGTGPSTEPAPDLGPSPQPVPDPVEES
jgi:hypothetical protein